VAAPRKRQPKHHKPDRNHGSEHQKRRAVASFNRNAPGEHDRSLPVGVDRFEQGRISCAQYDSSTFSHSSPDRVMRRSRERSRRTIELFFTIAT
jgi:hypothetical protein